MYATLPKVIRSRNLFLFFAWLGLVTGLVEAVRGWVWARTVNPLFRNDHALWMTPLAECLVFVLVGGVLWGLTCLLPARGRVAVAVFGVGILSGTAVAWGYIHPWALAVLALGLAISLVRVVKYAPGRLTFVVWCTTPLLVALTVALANWRIQLQNDRAPSTAVTPSPDSPNVVLIVWDTVRADFVNWRPGNETTPNLAELARRGTVFDRAIAPASWTLPTHASLFTGKYPDQLSSNWHSPLEGREVTLAEIFEKRGYSTGGFAGNLYYCNRTTGLHQGFQAYRDHTLSVGEVLRHSFLINRIALTPDGWSFIGVHDELGRKDGRQVIGEFKTWRQKQKKRPFFAFLNFFDAHDPYLPDRLLDGRRVSGREKVILRRWRRRWPKTIPPEWVELARACYTAQIRQLDRHLGEVIAHLKQSGQYERTLIVVTSDHGEQFGEHSLYSHGNSVRRALTHVPLVIAWPGHVPEARRLPHPVSLCDVGKTVLELSGQQSSAFPGTSLATLWSESAPTTRVRAALTTVDPHPRIAAFPHMCDSPMVKGKQYALLSGDWYMISEGAQAWHLYNFANDPREESDMVEQPNRDAWVKNCQAAFQNVVRSTLGNSRIAGTTTWLTNRPEDGQTGAEPRAAGGKDGGNR